MLVILSWEEFNSKVLELGAGAEYLRFKIKNEEWSVLKDQAGIHYLPKKFAETILTKIFLNTQIGPIRNFPAYEEDSNEN